MHNVNTICMLQQKYFATGATRNVTARVLVLKKLYALFKAHEASILSSIAADTGKSLHEAYITELGLVLHELSHIIKKLPKWAKPTRVPTPLILWPAKSRVLHQPLGTVLIISPWNYPFFLAVSPLIGSVAAGNCSILKMSSKAPATSEIVQKILSENFEPEFIAPLSPTTRGDDLFCGTFNHIFFTGSTLTGKAIMARASETLTPVTLELGGKSPCLVLEDAHIESTARRIVWGKLLNAGQTCVAPDYVLVPHFLQNQLIERMSYWSKKLSPANSSTANPSTANSSPPSPLLPGTLGKNARLHKIISPSALARLKSYLAEGDIAFGGRFCEKSVGIEFTIITNVQEEASLMKDEIFGPLLPIVPYHNLDDALQKILALPAPLALYLFTQNRNLETEIVNKIPCGSCCVNDTMTHMASPYLPFGGVGQSGMGRYHGKWSFENFSHKKAVLKLACKFDLPMRLPPITRIKERITKFLLG